MTELPSFSRHLLESAKYFSQQAKKGKQEVRKQAFLRASLYHILAYVEAQVNDIAEHFVDSGPFTVHELGMLLEKDIALEHGRFVICKSLKMARLTDRIELLASHFGEGPSGLPSYASLKSALKTRNALSHPKSDIKLTDTEVGEAIESSISVCSSLAQSIFGKGLPYADRGLDPTSDYC